MTNPKQELEAIRSLLRNNRELLMPVFGLMFWELAEAEARMSAEEFAEQGMRLTMEDPDDETIAAFLAAYIKLWLSAKDFNAASRFVADSLGMTADELLQTRQLYLNQRPCD